MGTRGGTAGAYVHVEGRFYGSIVETSAALASKTPAEAAHPHAHPSARCNRGSQRSLPGQANLTEREGEIRGIPFVSVLQTHRLLSGTQRPHVPHQGSPERM